MSTETKDHAPLQCDAPRLAEAVNYVLSNPGKGLRARLARASATLIGGDAAAASADTVATAIEWLHSYSLVHDDLPAMDNDDLRRGLPTVHKAFDEATAILVGDGLQAAAFGLIAEDQTLSPEQRVSLIAVIAQAVGFGGMVGGQALDMAAEKQTLTLEQLQRVHAQKTGALVTAAVVGGAICGGATEQDRAQLGRFAELIGLAFQVTDDILDVTASSDALGKTAGKDMTAQKSTYVRYLGLDGARTEASRLLSEALACLAPYGERANLLAELARAMVNRSA